MAGRLVSPLYISIWPLCVIYGVLGLFAVVMWSTGPADARYALLIPVVMFTAIQLSAAAALSGAVQRFAAEVEAMGASDPEVDASRHGDAVVRWRPWGLAVGGSVSRFHVRHFGFAVGLERVPMRLRGARRGAHAALHLVGRGGGVLGDHDGRIPGALGPEPFAWVAFGGGLAWVLVDMVLPWWLGAAMGVAVACAALSALLLGHTVNRRAMARFMARLQARGVRVDRPIRVWNGFSPRFVVPTSEGALLVGWLSLWRLPRLFVWRDGVELPRSAV